MGKKLIVPAILVGLLLGVRLFGESWMVTAGYLAVVGLGLLLRQSLNNLVIITLPFYNYVSVWGTPTLNFSPAFLVVLIALMSPQFWRVFRTSIQENRWAKWVLAWIGAFALTLFLSLIFNSTQVTVTNVLEVSKVMLGVLFAFWAFVEFFGMSARVRFEKIQVWATAATIIAAVGSSSYFLRDITQFRAVGSYLYSYRLQGPFFDPNLFSVYLLVSMGLGIIGLMVMKSKIAPILVTAILTSAIALAASRAATFAVLAFVAVGITLAIISRKWRIRWAQIGVTIVIVFFAALPVLNMALTGLGSVFTNSLGSSEISSVTPSEFPGAVEASSSATLTIPQRNLPSGDVHDVRFDLWLTGLDMWRTSPIFGVGYGEYLDRSVEFGSHKGILAHNTFVTFIAETGLLGLSLVLVPILLAVIALLRRRVFISTVVLATLAGLLVMMNTLNLQNSNFVWVFFGGLASWAMSGKASKPIIR